MVILNQPKWKKFLPSKGGAPINTNGVVKTDGMSGGKERKSKGAVEKAETPKKRKRTEEEIAVRKAKKLKLKGKESQEWKQLSEEHQKSKDNDGDKDNDGEATKSTENEVSAEIPDAALLSVKAKEIAKARREEKQQEKQQQKKKAPEKAASDRKSADVLEYLESYRAHIDSGTDWKFKKQHQNWIVKNLYTYPWKSDELVISYLKTVQGKARERLVEDAREVVKSAETDYRKYEQSPVERAQEV